MLFQSVCGHLIFSVRYHFSAVRNILILSDFRITILLHFHTIKHSDLFDLTSFFFFQPLSSVYNFFAACITPHSLSLHKKRLIAGCNYMYVQEPRSSDLERSPFLFFSLSFNFRFRRTPRFRILALLSLV